MRKGDIYHSWQKVMMGEEKEIRKLFGRIKKRLTLWNVVCPSGWQFSKGLPA